MLPEAFQHFFPLIGRHRHFQAVGHHEHTVFAQKFFHMEQVDDVGTVDAHQVVIAFELFLVVADSAGDVERFVVIGDFDIAHIGIGVDPDQVAQPTEHNFVLHGKYDAVIERNGVALLVDELE